MITAGLRAAKEVKFRSKRLHAVRGGRGVGGAARRNRGSAGGAVMRSLMRSLRRRERETPAMDMDMKPGAP